MSEALTLVNREFNRDVAPSSRPSFALNVIARFPSFFSASGACGVGEASPWSEARNSPCSRLYGDCVTLLTSPYGREMHPALEETLRRSKTSSQRGHV